MRAWSKKNSTWQADGSAQQMRTVVLPKFKAKFPEVGARLEALLNYVAPAIDDVAPKQAEDKKEPVKEPKPPGPVEPAVGKLNLDWQALGVGFGSGLLAGVLAMWQWREIRRRRQVRRPVFSAAKDPHLSTEKR